MLQEITQFSWNHPMLSLVWVVLLGAVIFTTLQSFCVNVCEVSRDEAIRLINKEDAVIIDLRGHDYYRKGHIANSVNLSEEEIKNGKFFKIDNNDKKKPVIVVSANGLLTSRKSAKTLNQAGFERVYVLKEGISGWSEEHLPLVRRK